MPRVTLIINGIKPGDLSHNLIHRDWADSHCIWGEGETLSLGDAWFNLCAALKLPAENLPLGQFLAAYYGLEGSWLAVEPIFWEASHSDASILVQGQDLALSQEEGLALFTHLQDFFAEEGLSLYFHQPELWLLKCEEKTDLKTKPAFLMRNESIKAVLSRLDLGIYWQKLMTSLQMFLHSTPFQRTPTKPPINGLWFYGSGDFKPSERRIFTDHAGLAKYLPQFQLVDLSLNLDSGSLIFITTPESFNFEALKLKLAKHSCHWLWNNTAYLEGYHSFWRKLWNRFSYENKTKTLA